MGALRRLREAMRAAGRQPEVVVLGEYVTEAEARLVVGLLRANGVPADTPTDSTDLYTGLALSHHRVLVRAGDVARARELLAEADRRGGPS